MAEEEKTKSLPKALTVLNISTVLAVLISGFSYLLFLKRDTVSQEENRTLAKFPEFTFESYLKGEYTEGIAQYYDDTVPNRSFFKNIISGYLMPLKGRKYGNDDGAELYGNAFEHKENFSENTAEAETSPTETEISSVQETQTESTSTETTTIETTTEFDETAPVEGGEITNNILVVNKRGILLYGGAWGGELEYASYLNEYKKRLGDEVNVYSMVIPTNVSFYLPENYRNLAASEKDDLDSLAHALDGVIPVDAYSALDAHKGEAIYSRTDHHWAALGAYYAAEKFAETAKVPFADITKYEKVTLSGYVGTLYGYTQSATLLNNPEEFVYYKPISEVEVTQYDSYFQNPTDVSLFINPDNLNSSSYYLVFGTDDRIAHVHTTCTNGRTLVIFKDSYGNALLPFLTSSFENIYLCDIRYFNINPVDFIKSVEADDVLFTMCTFSAVGSNKSYILNNLNN